MVKKRKKTLDYEKDTKTVSGVFDEKTRLSLYRLLNKNQIQIHSLIKEGKESVVFSGQGKDGDWVAIKVYRTEAMDFRSISKYLLGDPRLGKIQRKRRNFIYAWCKREHSNLKKAFEEDVKCPEPITYSDNILIMSFIGKNNSPSPRLIDIDLDKPQKIYKKIIKNMRKLAQSRLIHGDLSAYNILLHNEEPVLIDFSHGTTPKNPIAPELLKRDVKNINSFFTKIGIRVIDSEKLYRDLKNLLGVK